MSYIDTIERRINTINQDGPIRVDKLEKYGEKTK